MNAELARRVRDGLPPFDGVTFHGPGPEAVALVRLALIPIFDCLSSHYGDRVLYRMQDWYHHRDRSVTHGRVTTWKRVRRAFDADQSLFLWRSGHGGVRTMVYPDSYDFCLRFYVDHEVTPGESLNGHFDVTVRAELADSITNALESARIPGTCSASPEDYFLSQQ